jgi:hypothetical protein
MLMHMGRPVSQAAAVRESRDSDRLIAPAPDLSKGRENHSPKRNAVTRSDLSVVSDAVSLWQLAR